MCTHFTASQNEIADLFQVKQKKFFTSIMGQEYDARKKRPKIKTESKDQQPCQPASEVDPDMPPLEDAEQPKNKFKFKKPASKHFSKK